MTDLTMTTRAKSRSAEPNEGSEPNQDNPSTEEILRLLKKLDKNVEDLKAGQVKVESSLEALGSKLETQQSEIRDLQESFSFFSAELSTINDRSTTLRHEITEQQVTMEAQREKIENLQHLLNESQRFSRGFNLRFVGIPEEKDPQKENCIHKIEQLIEDHLKITVDIENAHRTGRPDPNGGKPRHIIAKFLRRPQRMNILRQKNALKNAQILVFEDLIFSDLESRRTLRPAAQEAYNRGQKVRFIKGDLFVDGRKFIPDKT